MAERGGLAAHDGTAGDHGALRLTRRAFARRGSAWLAAGGALAFATACGAGNAASKQDIEALRAEVAALKAAGKNAANTGADPPAGKAASAAAPGGTPGTADARWGYDGATGPDHWGDLAPEDAVCRTGSMQSPVDIAATQPGVGGRTNIKWQPAALTVVNDGHMIQANVSGGGGIEVDGVSYELAQLHFHTPSEHTIAGKRFVMETHFVHKSTSGNLAIIGLLHETGAANAALAPLWAALPRSAEDQKTLANFDLAALLPADRSMYRYAGSLTTPPCTEGVRWQILQSPTPVSDAQVKALGALLPPNARPLQPLNARDVLKEAIYKLR